MEELESGLEKKDKLVVHHSSPDVITGEEDRKDGSDESGALPLPKQKTTESRKPDTGRFSRSKKTESSATYTTGQDFVAETQICVEPLATEGRKEDSPGRHAMVTKPKKKPPLFRTKVSEENLEASIPRLTRQASQEEPLPPDNTYTRRRSNGRNKFLPRSQQVSDDSSPPPTPDIAIHIQQSDPPSVCRFPHQHSGDGPSLNPFIKQSSLEARSEPALSREPSQEKEFTDSKGVNLQQFIVDTLRKPQDRTMLLHLEKELADLVHSNASEKKFGPMSSYHRMIVHRVAAYFGLDHNVDQTGKAVIVNKTANTRIPEKKFKDHLHENKLDGPARRILKRDTASYEDKDYYDQSDKSDIFAKDDKKSKSFEERQELYDRVRARIFNQSQSSTTQEALTVDSPTRPKAILQFNSRQSSGASDDSSYHWKQDRPWSSVDSSGSEKPYVPVITKASSFAGSSISSNILMRDETGGGSSHSTCSVASSGSMIQLQTQESPDVGSTHSTIPLCYHKVASPVGSSFSQPGPVINPESTPCAQTVTVSWSGPIPSTVPPPGQFCMAPVIPGNQGGMPTQQPVLFIAPNIESVPPGCIIVNPQSGQPYLNKDGTAMVYQPITAVQQAHLSTGGISQQQMVPQSCQHSSIPQYSQPITETQLSNPQMMSFAPQQGQPPPLQMAPPIPPAEFQELQGQFVNLTLLNQESDGPSHIQVQQMSSSQPQQPTNQQVGILAMKAPVAAIMKGSTHDLTQPYQTVQQNQQIPGHYSSHLPMLDSGQQPHFHQAPSPQTSMQQLCQPSVQSQQMTLHPSQGITPIYFSAAQESQVADSQVKPQTMFPQGYPGAVTPSGSQSQIVYISEPQQYMEQSVPVFMSNSQSQLTSGQIVSSSRDTIRPTSPSAQTIPASYGIPPNQQVVGQSFPPMVQVQRSLPGPHVPPRVGTNYQIIQAPMPGTSPLLHTTNLPNQMPTAEAATRKEIWRIPQTYPTGGMMQSFRHQFTEKGNEEVLEVSQLPRDMTCQEVLPLLEDITQFGAKIYWLPKSNFPTIQTPLQVPNTKLVSDFTVLASFPNPELAQKAVFNSANAAYSLQQPGKNYFPMVTGE